jgi:non-specific serine/threonine protein kinase/serine/threonine-protein kinase
VTERWQSLSDLFARALEVPPEALDAFLRDACAGDAALEKEVRSLLAHHARAEGFLEPGAISIGAPVEGGAPEGLREGSALGAWRLLRRIGEGGMGTVWLAERADGQFVQRGALKLIRAGFASEELVRRFRRERQILAALDHPNIARLLDGGNTPEGLPYLVMEYIEGESLYEHCSRRALSVRDRLQLFLRLCAAVQYAHQKLVLHRDLKPGNVLVTPDGTPRLLDFGVGKMFDPEESTADLRTVGLPLTPQYASPEQLRGGEVTTSSDLYSLGVLLYELLTGAHPHPTRGTPSERMRSVLETDPPRPSTAVTRPPQEPDGASTRLPAPPREGTASLRRRLAGDLDNIVLKAMARDVARRYASVEQLADDVTRYLDGRPVHARPDAWSYRVGKFVRRNRIAVAASALAVVALVGGLTSALWQASVARRERAVAVQRLRDVQALANTLMFDVFDGIQDMPGSTAVRQKVIERAASYLEALSKDAAADSSFQISLADAYERLGGAQRHEWKGEGSGWDDAYRSFQTAHDLRKKILARYPNSEHGLLGAYNTCSAMALLVQDRDRAEEDLQLIREAEQYAERLVQLCPENVKYRQSLPRRQHNMALALILNDRESEAAPVLRKAMAGFAALSAADTADVTDRAYLGLSTKLYAQCMTLTPGGADRAEAAFRRAVYAYEEVTARRPNNTEMRVQLADAHYLLARLMWLVRQQPDSAAAHLGIAVRMLEQVAASDSANRSRASAVMAARATWAEMLAEAGRTAEARALLAASQARIEAMAASDTSQTMLLEMVPRVYFARGLVEMQSPLPRTASREAYARARPWLARAEQAFDRALAHEGGKWDLSAEEKARIQRALAACDSAAGKGVLAQRQGPTR